MSKDDSTWLNTAYVLFGLLVTYIAYKAMYTTAVQMGWEERYQWIPSVRMVGSFVIGAVVTWLMWANTDRHEYFLSSIGELRKVTFPSFQDTKQMTLVVVIVCIIFGIILATFDFIWGRSLKYILGVFGHVL